MIQQKVTLHRVFTTDTETVIKACKDADAIASRLQPSGFLYKIHSMDFRAGNGANMSVIHLSTGRQHSFGDGYLEILSHEHLVYTDRFTDPTLPGQITRSVSLRKVLCGTEWTATREGIPDAITAEICHTGWQKSLYKLNGLVETTIPDAR